jgi:hypothetical protein
MEELITMTYPCQFCGEENETLVDPTGGSKQSYIEDCTVCCRPNQFAITIFPDGFVSLSVEFDE